MKNEDNGKENVSEFKRVGARIEKAWSPLVTSFDFGVSKRVQSIDRTSWDGMCQTNKSCQGLGHLGL